MESSSAIASERMAKATIFIAVGIIVTALINGALLGYYIIQVNALQDQVRASQDQVNISRQQFESMTRPWVGIKEVHIQKIDCITSEPFVQPLTREEIDNPSSPAVYLSINQYVFRNRCSGLDVTFDVTVKNYGSIPAESIRIVYMMTDSRAPDWNENDLSNFESTVSSMQQYKTIVLMPQQETTIQLNQNVTLDDFPFLDVAKMEEYTQQNDVEERRGTFGAVPNLFLIGVKYEYGDNRADTLGIVFRTSETSELRIVDSWNPRFE